MSASNGFCRFIITIAAIMHHQLEVFIFLLFFLLNLCYFHFGWHKSTGTHTRTQFSLNESYQMSVNCAGLNLLMQLRVARLIYKSVVKKPPYFEMITNNSLCRRSKLADLFNIPDEIIFGYEKLSIKKWSTCLNNNGLYRLIINCSIK